MEKERISHLIYLAGFFDGEGSIFIGKDKNYCSKDKNLMYRLNVACGNSYREPIAKLYELFSISKKITHRKGYRTGYKPIYQWLVTANVAMDFLEEIHPYLIAKKNQALLGIEFQKFKRSLMPTGRKRTQDVIDKFEEYRVKIKELNDAV